MMRIQGEVRAPQAPVNRPVANVLQGGLRVTTGSIVVVPVDADKGELADTRALLADHQIRFVLETDQEVAVERVAQAPPTVVVVHGGPIHATMPDLLRRLCGATAYRTPLLVLIEQLTDAKEAMLLGSGADQVLGLPTSRHRLGNRIVTMYRHALLRGTVEGEQLLLGDLTIYIGRREVTVHGTPVELTKTEFDLLLALARDPGRVLSRAELTGGFDGRPGLGARALESHLSRLRRKVQAAGGPRLAAPVRGVGYRLAESEVEQTFRPQLHA